MQVTVPVKNPKDVLEGLERLGLLTSVDERGARYLISSADLGFPGWTVYLRPSTLEIAMPVRDIPMLDEFVRTIEMRLGAAGFASPVFGEPKLNFTLHLPLKGPARKALEVLHDISELLPQELRRAMLDRIGRIDVGRASGGMEWLIFRYSAVDTERPGLVMPLAEKHLKVKAPDRPLQLLGWISLLSAEIDTWLWLMVSLCATRIGNVEEDAKFKLLRLVALSSPIPEVLTWVIETFEGLSWSLSDEEKEVMRAFSSLMLSGNEAIKTLLSLYSKQPAEGSEGSGAGEDCGP